MNSFLISFGSIALGASLISCDRKPPAGTNTSEFREGKSGASTSTIENPKTDEPAPYPAAGETEKK